MAGDSDSADERVPDIGRVSEGEHMPGGGHVPQGDANMRDDSPEMDLTDKKDKKNYA